MAITMSNAAWQSLSNMNHAQSAAQGTISLGTVTVELSALAVALQKKARGEILNHATVIYLAKLLMYKPLIYQKTQTPHYQNALLNSSVSMICMSLKELDLVYYGVHPSSNSSTPTTQPTEIPVESTLPATKPVILINKYRGQNTSTKVKQQTYFQSFDELEEAQGGW